MPGPGAFSHGTKFFVNGKFLKLKGIVKYAIISFLVEKQYDRIDDRRRIL
jgi:hypothetical protein